MPRSNFCLPVAAPRLAGLVSLLLLFTACGPDGSRIKDGLIDDLPTVNLLCETLSTDPERPRFGISVVLNESKVKLAELGACGPVEAAEYAALGIPADALTAVGGYWAGLGEYVYARSEAGNITFYFGQIDEESTATQPDYVPLATFADNQFQIIRPLHQADLVGTYIHQSRDSGYVLFVGLRGDTIEATFFRRPGALPPPRAITQELASFEAQPLTDFKFFLSRLAFDSSLGAGLVTWTPDSSQLVFSRLLDANGQPRVFRQVR